MRHRWFPGRFGWKNIRFTKFWSCSFSKCHLVLILWQNSSKSLRNSGSFILFCIVAKSYPSFSIRVSVSVKTFRLRLKTVSEQKYISKRSSLVTPYLGYAKEVLMLFLYSKSTAFSCGLQAVGRWVVESILLETLAFCNSSNTDGNSLSCVENISSPMREKPESLLIERNWWK